MRYHAALSRILILGLVAVQTAAAVNKLYVNGISGNDQNNCQTPQTACKTIGHAISLASSGDAIVLAPATYPETLTINFDLGIFGAGASTTIIDGQRMNSVVSILSGRVLLSGLTLQNGETLFGCGGGISNSGSMYVLNTVITANFSDNQIGDSAGGGICSDGTAVLNHSTVSNNKQGGYYGSGNGIYNSGMMTIEESTVAGNSAMLTDASGGGISNGGTLIITRSTISGNEPGGGILNFAGGIYNAGTVILNNSTISLNRATAAGAIENELEGSVSLNSVTVTDNSLDALENDQGIITVQNAIVADNGGANCAGSITSSGYNLSSDNTCNLNPLVI